jgi:hypothetical protein
MDMGHPEVPDRRGAVRTVSEGELDTVILEQYKLAVEMADKISARRGTANGFYFTAASALLATSEGLSLAIAAIAGMALAIAWWMQLTSYRNLNAAKWQVIGELEDKLPAKPFRDEWAILKVEPLETRVLRSELLGRLLQPLARYVELSVVEQLVPLVYFGLFVATFVRAT